MKTPKPHGLRYSKSWTPLLIFTCVGFLVYGQTLTFSFLDWDDVDHILRRPTLTWVEIKRLFTEPYYGLYIPIPYLVWGTITRLFSSFSLPIHPFPYHALNLFLHIFNTFQVYKLTSTLLTWQRKKDDPTTSDLPKETIKIGPSILGALFFLLHPTQVESTVWISGMRDLLSATFGLWAVRLHFGGLSTGHHQRTFYQIGATLLFTLGVFCKPSLIILPVGMVCLTFISTQADQAYQNNHRVCWRAYYMISWLLATPLIIQANQYAQAYASFPHVPWTLRPFLAIDSLGFYVSKILVPFPLSSDYGRTPAWVMNQLTLALSKFSLDHEWIEEVLSFFDFWSDPDRVHASGSPPLLWTIFCSAILFAFVLKCRKVLPKLFWAGLSWWFCLLIPVLGWVPSAQQVISTVTDHYLYLPMAGISICISSLMDRSWRSWCPDSTASPNRPLPLLKGFVSHSRWKALLLLLFLFYSALSVRYSQPWRNDATFFSSMLAMNPSSASGHIGYGNLKSMEGNNEEASAHFRQARSLAPDNATAAVNYAMSLERLGQYAKIQAEIAPGLERVREDLSRPTRLRPEEIPFWRSLWNSVAAAQIKMGNLDLAWNSICQSLHLDISFPRTLELRNELEQILSIKTSSTGIPTSKSFEAEKFKTCNLRQI